MASGDEILPRDGALNERYLYIQQLMDKSDMDLLVALGSTSHGSLPSDAFERGTRIMARIRNAMKEKVCRNETVIAAARADGKIALTTAVADLLAPQFGLIPAATASILLVRSGIDMYCQSVWDTDAI
jgi:hypothetical protein